MEDEGSRRPVTSFVRWDLFKPRSTKGRRILLLTDAYPPEIRSCPALMKDLAIGLAGRGHDVTVLTTYPTYNLTPEAREAFAGVTGNIVRHEDGVRVVRVPAPPLHNVGPVVKGMSEAVLPALMSLAGGMLGPVDVAIVFSPPLTLGLAAAAVKAVRGCGIVLNVQDIMPQAAVDLGVLRNPWLIRAFEAVEEACYGAADVITCHSEGNSEWIRNNRPAYSARVETVPNWVDIDAYESARRVVGLKARLGLKGRFVLMFGGVMGFAQDLATVLEAARLLDGQSKAAFLLVGDGVALGGLRELAKGLSNVVFHPFVDPSEYAGWLKTVDAGLLTLKAEAGTPVVPSKMLSFMAAGKPYLAVVGRSSDARRITLEAESGVFAEPGDAGSVAAAVRSMVNDVDGMRAMGRRGAEYCRRHFSKDACIDAYDRILARIAAD